MMRERTLTGVKNAASIKERTPTGLKAAANVYIRTPTGTKRFYSSASATLTVNAPGSAYGGASYPGTTAVSTDTVTATVTGGTPPYTGIWTRTDGNPESWIIPSSTSPSTNFRCEEVGPGDVFNATFIYTATDSLGVVGVSNEVTATVTNIGGL